MRHGPALTAGILAIACIGGGIGIGAALWSGGSAAAAPHGTPRLAKPRPQTSKLFVVDAKSAWATSDSKGHWSLRMSGLNTVLWFADRPVHASGNLTARSLVASWSHLFVGGPPNGAIVAPTGPTGHRPTAIVLSHPTFDPKTEIATFALRSDTGQKASDAAWLKGLTKARSAANGRIVLFVDGSDYTDTFSLDGNPGDVFTADPGSSTCGTPYAITDTGGESTDNSGSTVELYFGSAQISNTGGCFFQPTVVVWQVTQDGNSMPAMKLNSVLGTLGCIAYCEMNNETGVIYYDYNQPNP
jgi:hypothetical protein